MAALLRVAACFTFLWYHVISSPNGLQKSQAIPPSFEHGIAVHLLGDEIHSQSVLQGRQCTWLSPRPTLGHRWASSVGVNRMWRWWGGSLSGACPKPLDPIDRQKTLLNELYELLSTQFCKTPKCILETKHSFPFCSEPSGDWSKTKRTN